MKLVIPIAITIWILNTFYKLQYFHSYRAGLFTLKIISKTCKRLHSTKIQLVKENKEDAVKHLPWSDCDKRNTQKNQSCNYYFQQRTIFSGWCSRIYRNTRYFKAIFIISLQKLTQMCNINKVVRTRCNHPFIILHSLWFFSLLFSMFVSSLCLLLRSSSVGLNLTSCHIYE